MEKINNKLFALYFINAIGIIFYLFESLIPPFELTYNMLLTGIFWYILMIIPAIIPILANKRFWRYCTLIIGGVTTLINIIISIIYLADDQFIFGLLLLFYWGGLGITAVVNTFKWIKQ